MKVFISWSGDQSRHIAEALRDWLPAVVQSVHPWVSSQDIEKGARSLEEIKRELQDTVFGIVCLTPENLSEKWIHFEAGALSKISTADTASRVWTYLWNVNNADVQGPLSQFQHTAAGSKEENRKLIKAINSAAADKAIDEKPLDLTFDAMWPKLEKSLQETPQSKVDVPEKRKPDSMIEEMLEIVRGIRDRDIASRRDELTHPRLRTELRSIGLASDRSQVHAPSAVWISQPVQPDFVMPPDLPHPPALVSCPECHTDSFVSGDLKQPFEFKCSKCGWTARISP